MLEHLLKGFGTLIDLLKEFFRLRRFLESGDTEIIAGLDFQMLGNRFEELEHPGVFLLGRLRSAMVLTFVMVNSSTVLGASVDSLETRGTGLRFGIQI